MEKNKSYDKADYKKKLYDALVESYNTNKDLFDSYGKVFSLKRTKDEKDKDQDPSIGSDRWMKRRKSSKDDESYRDSSHTVEDSDMQQDQEFVTGDNDEQLADKEVTKADWFKKPERPPTPNPDWSKKQQVDFRPPQTWISQVACAEEPPTSFDELNDTSFDFSAFSTILKNVPKATTERLDWHNPENKPYMFDLRKPLPLIQDHQGRQIIPYDYFLNNDLEYLKGGELNRRYSTYVTKTKAATYDLKWIKDLVRNLWSPVQVKYNQHAYLGTSNWGPKRQRFYGYASNLTSSKYVYSRRRIIAVTRLKIMKVYDYGHLEEIEEPHGMIYVDQCKRKRLMRDDELHKFSDGMLNDVRSALHDISERIRMEYLPMRKWSNLDKKKARLNTNQSDGIDRLTAEIKNEEGKITERRAWLEQQMVASPMLALARMGGREVNGMTDNIGTAVDRFVGDMECLVACAHYLREKIVAKVIGILTTSQSVRFLAGVAQLQLRIRSDIEKELYEESSDQEEFYDEDSSDLEEYLVMFDETDQEEDLGEDDTDQDESDDGWV
ncbi:retrovirus-related pol polyprotein from transposon TNT 1-94 [Tanacetum coccineum]